MNKILNVNILLVCYLLYSSSSVAQVESLNKDAPPLKVAVKSVYESNLNPTILYDEPAYGVALSSEGRLIATQEQFWWVVDYSANIEKYQLIDENDSLIIDDTFNDIQGRLLLRTFIKNKWFVDTSIKHVNQTQALGSGISRLQVGVTNADRLSQNKAAISLVYGSDSSERFLSIKISTQDDEYDDINQYATSFNVTQQALALDFAFKQSSFSRIIVKTSIKHDDYDDVTRQDSVLIDLLLGLEWSPSGKSKLKALIGKYQRNFEDDTSNSGVSWYLDYTYYPREDITFSLTSARFSDVSISTLTTDTITQDINISLKYRYNQRWSWGMNMGSSQIDLNQEMDVSILKDNFTDLELGMHLKDHSMVQLKLGYQDVISENSLLTYKQKSVSLAWSYIF